MARKIPFIGFTIIGILVLTLAAVYTAAFYLNPPQVAQAASATQEPEVVPLAPAGTYYRSCVIKTIYVDQNLMLLVCTTEAPVNIDRYAIPGDAASQVFLNRALTILNTAYALNQTVSISFDESSTTNPSGCSSINCRKLLSVSMSH